MATTPQVPDAGGIWLSLLEKALWPLCVVALVVFFVLLFRGQLRDLLKSLATRPLKWGRAEIAAPTGASEQPVPAPVLRVDPARDLTQASVFEQSDNPYLKSRTEDLTRQVNSMTFESEAQKYRWLLREGASVLVQLDFERIYIQIWESQLELLFSTNLYAAGLTLAHAKEYWAGVAAANPELKDSFERWYSFPVGMGLITLEGEVFKITPRGKLFLEYLIHHSYDPRGLRRGV